MDANGLAVRKAGSAIICEGVRRRTMPSVGLRVGSTVMDGQKEGHFVVSAVAVPAKGAAVASISNMDADDLCIRDVAKLTVVEADLLAVEAAARENAAALLVDRFNPPVDPVVRLDMPLTSNARKARDGLPL